MAVAQPPPNPNFTGAQKQQYAQQYGGYWNGSQYNPTGTAPPASAPVAAAPIAAPANTATSASSTTSSTMPVGMSPAAGPGVQGAFQKSLLGLLSQDPNKVSLSDPDLAPQARAFQDAQTRSLQQQQQQLAEQAFAGGTRTTGAYGADLGALQQQQGEAIAQHNADLLGNAKQQRVQSLLGAMGLNVQNTLGQGDLALRGELGRGQLGLGLLQALLGDRQANNALGLNAGEFMANLNQSALLKSLGL